MVIVVKLGGNVFYVQALCHICSEPVDKNHIFWYTSGSGCEVTARCEKHEIRESHLAPS